MPSSFEKTLAKVLAEEAAKSVVVSRQVAKLVGENEQLFLKVLGRISPELLAKELANQIVFAEKAQTFSKATSVYAQIMKGSIAMAKEVLAQQILDDVRSA